jgi:hypothetical protein
MAPSGAALEDDEDLEQGQGDEPGDVDRLAQEAATAFLASRRGQSMLMHGAAMDPSALAQYLTRRARIRIPRRT